MKKILKIVALAFVTAFIAVQFYRPDYTNPPIVQAETIEATTQIPENVAQILTRSCSDCHTNQTVYPWYSDISPFSWLLVGHIEEGRGELNLSVWNTYKAQKKRRKLGEICEQVVSGEMPHNQYLWLHRDAQLSAEDKQILCDWTDAERAKIVEP
ncbi:MAG: heme-binding domain-containing protein [Pyrinomonadaceae bacterium]|nr:heme-binding domain-containing protein [Pyrinomonadaceae bacterium]